MAYKNIERYISFADIVIQKHALPLSTLFHNKKSLLTGDSFSVKIPA